VLDVGAHHGWFFHCWLDWCPQAEVHAFEPTLESFERMRALYGDDPRVHLTMAGVGAARGELTLNILEGSQVSNSFLAPDRATWESVDYHTGAIRTRSVPVVTLDDYAREHGLSRAHLLKIDVQGFELEVLRGARDLLLRTDYVFVESGIRRLYEGAPSFAETFLAMEAAGFHLVDLRVWHRGNRVLMESDLLFRRDDLAPPVRTERDRDYLELLPPA
jgi:FkbM family methyltransferase